MRAAPVILTGPLAPRGSEAREAQSTRTVHPGLYSRISALLRGKRLIVDRPEKTPYEVVFASRYSRHMIQVTAPEDQVDGKTGHKTKGRPIVVKFDRGLFSVPKGKYNIEQATTILNWLRAHPSFGPGKDFWEQKDVENDALVRKTVSVIEDITANKPMREAVLEFLSRGDFFEDETKGDGLSNRVIGETEDEDEETEEVLADAGEVENEAEFDAPETEPERTPKKKKGGWPKGKPRKLAVVPKKKK